MLETTDTDSSDLWCRWEDQEKIRKKIEEGPLAGPLPGGKKGKKGGKSGGAGGQLVDGTLLGDFRTEYAKSGAAKCRKCEEKIKKVSNSPADPPYLIL